MGFFRTEYSKLSDEELMRMLLKNERSAFDELYKRYSGKLINYFFRFLNYDKEKARDMLHDLFIKIIEDPVKFDTNRKFSNWVYTIATNMIKNEYKKMEIRNVHKNEVIADNNVFVESNWTRPDISAFTSGLNNELENLDIDSRALFELRYKQELSVKEIAAILDIPEGTVKSRLFYLVKGLADKLAVFNPNR